MTERGSSLDGALEQRVQESLSPEARAHHEALGDPGVAIVQHGDGPRVHEPSVGDGPDTGGS